MCCTVCAVSNGGAGPGPDLTATTSGRLRQVAAEDGARAAVVVDDDTTTYAELDRAADELAAALLRVAQSDWRREIEREVAVTDQREGQ